MITFEEFKRLEIKVAKIKEVKDHPNADKLYVMTIDLGDKTKQIVAGIKSAYTKEELVGKQIVVVDNLEPAVLRGVESQAMLLAAQDNTILSLLIPEKEVKAGAKVC
ncbi:MAG: methionine--tRNA ligase subunit beta [Candidatus Omnitrophota bacterium]|nr:methionine--tRNA ligase subunit beta [Candidatus Omnitrophota bacterium]